MNSKLTQRKELVHQASLKPETKTTERERRNRNMKEKFFHRIKKRNLNIKNHHDLEVSHENIIEHSFHNLKF